VSAGTAVRREVNRQRRDRGRWQRFRGEVTSPAQPALPERESFQLPSGKRKRIAELHEQCLAISGGTTRARLLTTERVDHHRARETALFSERIVLV